MKMAQYLFTLATFMLFYDHLDAIFQLWAWYILYSNYIICTVRKARKRKTYIPYPNLVQLDLSSPTHLPTSLHLHHHHPLILELPSSPLILSSTLLDQRSSLSSCQPYHVCVYHLQCVCNVLQSTRLSGIEAGDLREHFADDHSVGLECHDVVERADSGEAFFDAELCGHGGWFVLVVVVMWWSGRLGRWESRWHI